MLKILAWFMLIGFCTVICFIPFGAVLSPFIFFFGTLLILMSGVKVW